MPESCPGCGYCDQATSQPTTTWVKVTRQDPVTFTCTRCGKTRTARRFTESTLYRGHRICTQCRN